MEQVEHYRDIIQQEMERLAKRKPANKPEIVYQFVMDAPRNQFILLALGWHEEEYLHNWIFHVEIKDNKIWVHEDLTDIDISTLLQEKGIPTEDIILGYVAPHERNNPSSSQNRSPLSLGYGLLF